MEISSFQCKYTQFSIIKNAGIPSCFTIGRMLYTGVPFMVFIKGYASSFAMKDFTVSEKLLDNIPAVTQPVHTFSSVILISLCNFICCVTGNEKKKHDQGQVQTFV